MYYRITFFYDIHSYSDPFVFFSKNCQSYLIETKRFVDELFQVLESKSYLPTNQLMIRPTVDVAPSLQIKVKLLCYLAWQLECSLHLS